MGFFNFNKSNEVNKTTSGAETKDIIVDAEIIETEEDESSNNDNQKIIKLSDLEPSDQNFYLFNHAAITMMHYNDVPHIRLRFGDLKKEADEFFDAAREHFADLPVDDIERYYVVDDSNKISQSLAYEGIVGLINMMYSLPKVEAAHHKKELTDTFPDKKIQEDTDKLKEALRLLGSGNFTDIEDILICSINDYRDLIDSYLKNTKDAILGDVRSIIAGSESSDPDDTMK